MRELLDRHLGAGWMRAGRRPADLGRRSTRSRPRSCGRRAAVSAPSWSRSSARRSVADRLMRGDLREYVDAAARAFDPEVLTLGFARRVATYKRLDLLTRDPEWTLALLGGRPSGPGRPGRQGPPARRGGQARRSRACSGSRRARIVGERVVFLDDYDLASAALARPRLRRVAQPAAAAAGGQRHQRDEVGLQRRPAAQRARRLVGRGLRRQQRLGDPRRGRLTTTTPRTSATPRSLHHLLERRGACPPSTSATRRACRSAGSS